MTIHNFQRVLSDSFAKSCQLRGSSPVVRFGHCEPSTWATGETKMADQETNRALRLERFADPFCLCGCASLSLSTSKIAGGPSLAKTNAERLFRRKQINPERKDGEHMKTRDG